MRPRSNSRTRRPASGSNSAPTGRTICVLHSSPPPAIKPCLLGLKCWSTLASVRNTVLICDDAAFMRSLLSDILTDAGFQVVGEAQNGAEAVDKFRQLRPDLATRDILMPDMGGIDAVREIVKLEPRAKVLMCSAMGQHSLVLEAIRAGATDFVVKPFQPSRVLEAVQRVLA